MKSACCLHFFGKELGLRIQKALATLKHAKGCSTRLLHIIPWLGQLP